MKAKSFQIRALKSQLQKDFDAVLLFGNDEGELNHTFFQLKQELDIPNDAFHLIVPTKEDLKKTPFLATDEANTPSLISGRRFIVINEDLPFEKESLIHFLSNKMTDAFLIIKGGNLNKSNALRVESEKNPRVLALACYAPSVLDIQKQISSYLFEHHKTIAPKLLSELCKKLSFNQQVIIQELDKLLLYLGDQKEVDEAAIQNILTNSAEADIEEFCIALADGNVEKSQHLLSLYLAQGESEAGLFRVVRLYFERLASIVSNTSVPIQTAVEKALRADQFRLKDPLSRQALYWKSKDIMKFLNNLTQLEIQTRTTGYVPETMVAHAFLSFANSAKKLSVLR